MQISIKGTNLDLTPSIKEYVEEKIGHLAKFLVVDRATVELEKDKHHHTGLVMRAEVMMFAGGKVIRADAVSEDIYASVDLVIPKLKEQISKFKDKKQTMQRRGARSAKKKR